MANYSQWLQQNPLQGDLRTQSGSDAPMENRQQPSQPKLGKIFEIASAVMTYGASTAGKGGTGNRPANYTTQNADTANAVQPQGLTAPSAAPAAAPTAQQPSSVPIGQTGPGRIIPQQQQLPNGQTPQQPQIGNMQRQGRLFGQSQYQGRLFGDPNGG
jgi:hypothetical protein